MMGLVARDDGWRIPDETWEQMEPLLPPRPSHPLGCHNPRVPDRDAMNAILLVLRTGMQWNALLVLRTGMQWNALNATGICSSSSAHRRFQEWAGAGLFEEFWRQGLLAYEELRTHSWLNRFRGLLIRWSKKPENHRAFLQLACGLVTWRLATAKDLPG
jgi:transposase